MSAEVTEVLNAYDSFFSSFASFSEAYEDLSDAEHEQLVLRLALDSIYHSDLEMGPMEKIAVIKQHLDLVTDFLHLRE
mgnify:CR=1 FL=1|tara:strand:- start:360 stop:593 length:234 start_codon:yes stop_codon:yes gene_type:complete